MSTRTESPARPALPRRLLGASTGPAVAGRGAPARVGTGLPVVVVVEASEPAVVIHRYVQMHLVAGGAELRGLLPVERLQESAPVRLGIDPDQVIVHLPHDRVLALREIVQGRV